MDRIFSRRRARAAGAFAAAVLLVVSSCRKPSDPVRGALDDLAKAAGNRDAGRILDLLTPDFQSADGLRREAVEQTLRRLFASYERLDVAMEDVTVERSESAALARLRVRLSGKPRAIAGLEGFLPRESAYRFEIRFVPLEGRWRAAWASWHEER